MLYYEPELIQISKLIEILIAKSKKHYIFLITGAELHLTALKKYTS